MESLNSELALTIKLEHQLYLSNCTKEGIELTRSCNSHNAFFNILQIKKYVEAVSSKFH